MGSLGLQAAQVTPIYNLSFLGGQNFFDGTASSVAGNVDALVTPVVKFSDRWSLFPTYQGTYQGTQDIQELAGGGTLFQDSTSQALVVKSVHKLGDKWKIKPSVGGRVEWLRETRDEEWGEGLFDYRKVSGGLEGEYALSPMAGGRLAYDYYQLAFPNYQSLESAQDPTLSRELVGEDVLDNDNHMGTFSLWSPLPARGRFDLTAVYNLRNYSDQPVVAPSGDLTATKRKDSVSSLVAAAAFPIKSPNGVRLTGQLGLGLGVQTSNQDHYDARKAVYVADYYDYTDWRVAPRVTAGLAQGKWLLSLAGSYERREYGNRPAQDANGDYVGSKLWVSTLLSQLAVVRPLSAHMRLRLEASLGWSQSNTDYEKVFAYNYRMANYLVGFSYEY
jgi:hypothetical protein